MTPVTQRLAALAVTLLAGMGSGRAAAPADERFAPLAHSAQLTVDAAMLAPEALTLRIRHAADQSALAPASQIEVRAQGRTLGVTANSDGTWSVSLKELGGKPPGTLDLVIGHDGIRELLSGALAPPAAGAANAAASLVRDHKQLAWWILNIAIVLIAAIAISRRVS
jgi:hypothetical protein